MSASSARRSSGARLPSLGPRGEGWFALQVLLLGAIGAAGVLAHSAWPGVLAGPAVAAGAILIAAGLAVGFAGIRALDISLSPLPKPTDNGLLIVRGLYGVVRHPIYVGLVLASLGWSLMTASFAALVVTLLLCLLLDLKARREEAWLRERYPGYAAYAEHTRRFIPWLY